jgi:hypothetical protein
MIQNNLKHISLLKHCSKRNISAEEGIIEYLKKFNISPHGFIVRDFWSNSILDKKCSQDLLYITPLFNTNNIYIDIYNKPKNYGIFHCENNQPAYISINEFGEISGINYYYNNTAHRNNGPQSIKISNSLKFEEYKIHGKRRNHIHGPALKKYRNGILISYNYFLNNIRHNSVGPAVVDLDFKIFKYFIFGKEISKESFFKNLDKRLKER